MLICVKQIVKLEKVTGLTFFVCQTQNHFYSSSLNKLHIKSWCVLDWFKIRWNQWIGQQVRSTGGLPSFLESPKWIRLLCGSLHYYIDAVRLKHRCCSLTVEADKKKIKGAWLIAKAKSRIKQASEGLIITVKDWLYAVVGFLVHYTWFSHVIFLVITPDYVIFLVYLMGVQEIKTGSLFAMSSFCCHGFVLMLCGVFW
jgi:hypothetical protein